MSHTQQIFESNKALKFHIEIGKQKRPRNFPFGQINT